MRHRVLHADEFRAEIEIQIEAIDFFDHGRYLGTVDRIPHHLRTVRAEVRSDGVVFFDRNLFVIGTPQQGFELVSTRYYGAPLYHAFRPSHGMRVGRISLASGRVWTRSHSRFFGRHPFVPVSLLPDDDRLWAYGYEAGARGRTGIERGYWSELPGESAQDIQRRAVHGEFDSLRRHEDNLRFEGGEELSIVQVSEVFAVD
jgi:hypothetical protein